MIIEQSMQDCYNHSNGAAFDKTYEGWTFYPFIFSNGGQVVNEQGNQLLLDSPESVEAMQALADLMWVHHVTPTPRPGRQPTRLCHQEAAIRFYKFHNNPEAADLFAAGLWMPLQKAYYTEPDKMKFRLDNPVHPAGKRLVFTDYIVNYSRPLPSYYLRNYAQVLDLALQPAIQRIWNNEAAAAEALRQAVQAAAPLMQGCWDR